MYQHGVNNAMGTKSGAVWYRQSRNATDANVSYTKLAIQDRYHGRPDQRRIGQAERVRVERGQAGLDRAGRGRAERSWSGLKQAGL